MDKAGTFVVRLSIRAPNNRDNKVCVLLRIHSVTHSEAQKLWEEFKQRNGSFGGECWGDWQQYPEHIGQA